MDDWKKISETSLPEKLDFYCSLNMKDITDADYRHAKTTRFAKKDLRLNKITIYVFKAIQYC